MAFASMGGYRNQPSHLPLVHPSAMTTSTRESISIDTLIAELASPDAYPAELDSPVVVHQTHISCVFLAGDYAYKVKKPVKNEFLDYATLEKRRHFCEQEVRLDQRYAGDLYLGVVPITLEAGKVRVEGKGEAVEYAVKMRRFPGDALLSDRLEHGKLSQREVHQLARVIATFHGKAERVDPHQTWGSPGSVYHDAIDNVHHLLSSRIWEQAVQSPGCEPATNQPIPSLKRLRQWTDDFFDENQLSFSQRLASGFVRECHGDLHLDNVIYWNGQWVPFDGIEFNDEFRLIDVMNDAAFLGMDLAVRGHLDLSRSFINAYLQETGDHASLPLLRWYLVYRALVRAKVASICAEQQWDVSPSAAQESLKDCIEHIDLADRYSLRMPPCLWITHGVSGSGKSTGSERIVQRCGAICLRSDIERKRHFGLSPTERPEGRMKQKLYCESANHATYNRLRRLASGILHAGFSAVIDATFLEQSQRARFRELADQQGADFAIVDFQADEQTLKQRLVERSARNEDASDADLDVLARQLETCEPLTAEEIESVVPIPDAVSAIRAL